MRSVSIMTQTTNKKTLYPSMFRRSLEFSSDNSRQDRGYDRGHRQTDGGFNAYRKGHAPLSYWNKSLLKSKMAELVRNLENEDKKAYKAFLSTFNIDTVLFLKTLFKFNLQDLQLLLLEYSGVHYTGNHFRYTHFYTFTKNIRIVLQKLKHTKQFAEVAPKQMTLPIEVIVHREYPC